MGFILRLLTSKITGPIALGGCAFLLVLLIAAKVETGVYKRQAAGLQVIAQRHQQNHQTCLANYTDAKATEATLRADIATWKAEAAERAAATSRALSETAKAQSRADRSATALLNYKAKGANQCEQMLDALGANP